MKPIVIATVSLLVVLGCKPQVTVSGANGEKVTSDTSGNLTVTDNKGTKTDITTGNNSFDAKSSNGAQVHIDNNGVTSKDEKGQTFSMGSETVTEAEMGLPYYPGSAPKEHSDMKSKSNGEMVVSSVRTSSDSPDKVAEFYKAKLTKTSVMSGAQMASVSGALTDKRKATIIASQSNGQTTIQVMVSSGK